MNTVLIESIARLIGPKRPTHTSRIDELKKLTGLDDSSLRADLATLQAMGYLTVGYANGKIKLISVSNIFPQ
ncbi:hypothetical protein [Liquorilactobacillus satsumensis]|uniref:Uncharacterized protein n=1 Tax=Liquorilactobacillus satsumensis DSM 16230 = JCM 12392 TaxID=1423801 RepID=A0A0R1V3N5_9LACO|nr:hypothetical protein [Liquorilactobacillus satsumensis]KRL99764.1 hypothetical protein FD50_GL000085 [Liquorilactobacillus satsumensis DSM 16230 = JCM 12392]